MKQKLYLAGLFGAHATCSVSMVLLNKTIAQGFDVPWTVLLIQNIGTVCMGYLHSCFCGKREEGSNKKDEPSIGLPGIPGPTCRRILGIKVPRQLKSRVLVLTQVVLFMGTLFLSLKALRFISVPLYVVARNTVPAQTALLERVFTGVKLSVSAVLGLVCTICGAVVYTYGDLHSGLALGGVAYAMMLTLIVSGCSIVDKIAVRTLGQEDIKPVEVNQIRVALALPLNLLFVLAFDLRSLPDRSSPGLAPSTAADLHALRGARVAPDTAARSALYLAATNMSLAVLFSLLLSTLFGFGMGTFNFYLQQVVSAATVQVANILYKLTTTLLSLVTHPASVTATSWLGYSISLFGIALYTFGPRALPIA